MSWSVIYSTPFTGADAGTLGTGWDGDTGVVTDWNRAGNAAQAQGHLSNGNWIFTTSAAHADTADVKVTVTQLGSAGDGALLLRATAKPSAQQGYACYFSSGGANIYRSTAGTEVGPLAGGSITQVANGVCAFEIVGSDLKCHYQGVQIASYSDASPLTTAGRTGLANWIAGTNTNSTYDDFQVEAWTADAGGTGAGVLWGRALRSLATSRLLG